MEHPEIIMVGKFITEVVVTLPDWNSDFEGRLIYEQNSKTLWIGGSSLASGNSGWLSSTPQSNSINSNQIDWDTDLNDGLGLKINASHVPCNYKDTTSFNCIFEYDEDVISNVQHAIDDMRSYIEYFITGKAIHDNSIKKRHIDRYSPEGLTADDIYLENDKLLFGPQYLDISIENALEHLTTKRADVINLARPNTFGQKINIASHTVQEAFEGIEFYLDTLSAEKIHAWLLPFNLFCDTQDKISNVQSALDYLYREIKDRRFSDLIDISCERQIGQVLKSCCDWTCTGGTGGSGSTGNCGPAESAFWDWVIANDIVCLYPDIVGDTNIQAALWTIYNNIQDIEDDIIELFNRPHTGGTGATGATGPTGSTGSIGASYLYKAVSNQSGNSINVQRVDYLGNLSGPVTTVYVVE